MQKSESLPHDNFISQVCIEKVKKILSSGEISVILSLEHSENRKTQTFLDSQLSYL